MGRRTPPPISRETVMRHLSYNPETGVFTRRIRSGNAMPGDVAGYRHSSGYILIAVEGYAYMAHNLAWLILHDELVFRGVDHRDNDRGNNQEINLRRATGSQNCANRVMRSDNTSGIKGVSFDRQSQRWRAHLTVHGKRRCLGRYPTIEEATVARRAAFNAVFGAFARHA